MATTIAPIPKAPPPRRPRASKKLVLNDARMTVEQWAVLPEIKPQYELVDGILVRKLVTTTEHDWTVSEVNFQCRAWGRVSGWRFFSQGVGTRIDPFNGFVPDVMGFPPEVIIEADATFTPPPFIVFEVISQRTARMDRGQKLTSYQEAAVPLYVIVDLKKHTLEIHRLKQGKYGRPEVWPSDATWQPAELPGLAIELQRLWFSK